MLDMHLVAMHRVHKDHEMRYGHLDKQDRDQTNPTRYGLLNQEDKQYHSPARVTKDQPLERETLG